MMGRLLNHVSLETDIRLISIAGGTKNNVISSECKAEILVAKEDADKVKASVACNHIFYHLPERSAVL